MALTSLGLGGILSFDSKKATQEMKKAHMAFGQIDLKASKFDKTIRLATDNFKVSMAASRAAAVRFAKVMSVEVVKAAVRMGAAVSKAVGTVTVRAFRMAGRAAKRFAAGVKRGLANTGKLMNNVGSAARSMGMALLPTTLILKKGMGVAAGFEKQMSNVRAVMKGISDEDMKAVILKSKEMGIKSAFSAQESGEAFEALGMASFSAKEGIVAIEDVMAAAAAGSMELGDAARLVASNVRAFGLEAKGAGMVSDVLAITSARTNTTMTELGESLKFVAPFSKLLNVDIAETSAVLGLLADAGIQGSAGGTAMKNALIKLAAPTKKSQKALAKLNLSVKTTSGDFVGMDSILTQLQKGMNKMGGNVDRAAVASKLFGVRGIALTSLLSRLDKGAEGSARTFKQLNKEFHNSEGAAKEMAKTRLDNVLGQLVLLGSSIQGTFIEIFEGVLGPMKSAITAITGHINSVLTTVLALKDMTAEARAEFEKVGSSGEGLSTIEQVALGVMDAIEGIGEAWDTVTRSVQEFSVWINEKLGGEGVRNLTRVAIKFVTIAGALTPVLLGVGLLAWVLKATLVPAISAVGLAFKVALGPVGLIIGGIILVLQGLKKENEDMFDVVVRVWNAIGQHLKSVWTNVLKPFIDGFQEYFGAAILAIKDIFTTVFDIIGVFFRHFVSDTKDSTTQGASLWKAFGQSVGFVFGAIATTIKIVLDFVKFTIEAVASLIDGVLELIGIGESKAKQKNKIVGKGKTGEDPILQAFVKAGAVKAGVAIPDIKSMELARKRMWAAKIAENMTPEQLKGASASIRSEIGPEFIGLIKNAWKARDEAEVARFRDDKPIKVDSTIVNKQTIEVNPTLCVDRKKVATAMARHQIEVMERTSSKKKAWQPRAALEFAAIDISR